MNFQKAKKYFKSAKFNAKALLLLLIWPLFIVYLIYLMVVNMGKPADGEIDQAYQDGLSDVVEKGLKKLGIDEDEVKLIDPIVIHGPYDKNIASQFLAKKGNDGRWRSSNYEVTVLYFSERQVYSYDYRFSITDNERNESTDEFFYKDIVAVSTSSDNITLSTNEAITREYFKLTTSGGTSIECSIWDMGQVEKSIKGMKQLLREKKSS